MFSPADMLVEEYMQPELTEREHFIMPSCSCQPLPLREAHEAPGIYYEGRE